MHLNLNQLSRTVNWHFTSTCNMSCRYCFVPRCKEITLLESYTVLEKLKPYFSRINFVGGEPTCSSKLIPLSKKAKELGYIVSMVTNGYWLYKNNIIHSYEKQCFLQDNDFLVCDFYIPSIDVYIEYWGKYQHNYISRKKDKQELYKENNIKLINVEYDNLKNIDNFMISQIKYYQEKK